jgi:Protein of unknown function (DUF2971)
MGNIVYHYTTLNVLQKILEEAKDGYFTMRASHIKYLNDTSEYVLAIKLLQNKLIEYDNVTGKNSKNLSKLLNDKRMSFFESEDIDDDFPFIISFSSNDDSLPMWNSYADNSQGVAIGLKVDYLSSINSNFKFETCLYQTNQFEKYLEKNIKEIHNVLKVNEYSIGVRIDYDSDLFKEFYKNLPILKDNAFEYENENRLVIPHTFSEDDNLKYQINGNILKPYKEIKIPLKAFSEIILGPRSSFELIKTPLLKMFKRKGLDLRLFKNDDIVYLRKSNCPYRVF